MLCRLEYFALMQLFWTDEFISFIVLQISIRSGPDGIHIFIPNLLPSFYILIEPKVGI